MSFVCLECKTWFDTEHGYKTHVGMMHPTKFVKIFGVYPLSIRKLEERVKVAERRFIRSLPWEDPRKQEYLEALEGPLNTHFYSKTMPFPPDAF